MVEKRKYIRLRTPIEVVYQVIKKHKHRVSTPSAVKDLSGGGIRIVVKHDLRVGDLLGLEIQIPHFEKSVEAVAEVVWLGSSREDETEVREAGLRFRDIEPKALHRILEYVHSVGIG